MSVFSRKSSRPRDTRASPWRLRILVSGLVALIVGPALIVICSDAPPPDVSDLEFVPLVVPDAENLYVLLCAKGDALARSPLVPEDAVDETVPLPAPKPVYFGGSTVPEWSTPTPPELLPRLLAGEGWTPERIDRWRPVFDQLSAELRAITAHTRIQGSVPASYQDSVPSRSIRMALSAQLRLAVWAAYRDGRHDEAMERALLGVRIGLAVRDARGPIMDYLNGIAITRDFYRTLHALALQPDIEPALLRRLIAALATEGDAPDGYADALRNEFGAARDYLAKLTSQDTSGGALDASGPLTLVARTRVLFPLIYKRNLTIGLCADSVREGLGFVEYPELKPVAGGGGVVTCLHCQALSAEALKRPVNALGRFAHMQVMPVGQLAYIRQAGWLSRSYRSALQAVAAVRLYREETGAYPDSLERLVPEYLDAVPMDYVDRTPIRYSGEHEAIWAKRQNGKALAHPPANLYPNEVYLSLTTIAWDR